MAPKKSGNPAAKSADAPKKVNKPATYVLYKLSEDRGLAFVTTAVGVTRNDAISAAVASDAKLAGVPLVPIAESRLVQLSGALPEKPRVKVTQVT